MYIYLDTCTFFFISFSRLIGVIKQNVVEIWVILLEELYCGVLAHLLLSLVLSRFLLTELTDSFA